MRCLVKRSFVIVWLFICFAFSAFAQSSATRPTAGDAAVVRESLRPTSKVDKAEEERRTLRAEVERLRDTVTQQLKLIDKLQERIEQTEQSAISLPAADLKSRAKEVQAVMTGAASKTAAAPEEHTISLEERLGRLEAQTKRTSESLARNVESLNFSGEIRLRYESTFGQLNGSANAENPAVLGNELTARNRMRIRARLAVRGKIGNEFEWGLRLSTGSTSALTSTNQTLTDFYSRKPFSLDQVYISYKPARVPGLRLQGGKFEAPWVHTDLTFDKSIQTEGLNESYSRDFKTATLRNFSLVAWQLPFLERNSAFIRKPDGTVSKDESHRAGRDLALYGGQARVRLQPDSDVALTLSVADLYFSGTQFISPLQFFGGQLQLPVTFTIPATATEPARTVTAQVAIPREFLVSGNAGLGLSTATNNAVNRNGRLSSGYNLVDMLGRLDFLRSARYPVALTFNYIVNTQVRDVIIAKADGADLILPNNENRALWAEIQVGKTQERGDMQFGYTFMRIAKDAVLTPFNYDDLMQQSDVRAQRFSFGYAADSRVILSLTGIVAKRLNGLGGVFGATPAGSLNTPATRLQFDTTFRF
jgi:hypothetical protein